MTDRDRLINELKKAKNKCLIYESGGCLACKYRGQADCTIENIADQLLANGVIVPPCKVGDKVYCNEMDAFFETDGYKPRSPKRSKPKETVFEQIELVGEDNG